MLYRPRLYRLSTEANDAGEYVTSAESYRSNMSAASAKMLDAVIQ